MRGFLGFVTLGLLAIASLAIAENAPVANTFDPSEIVLTPRGVEYFSGSLDDPQPDTIRYDNGAIQSFYSTANHWARVRFTAPDEFEVRSVYFVANNPAGSAAPCSVFVHAATGGNMGAQLAGGRITGNVVHFGDFATPTWNDHNLPDSVDIAAATDFFIVIGPAPGGPQAAGWHILLDAGATQQRSAFGSQGHTGAYGATTGDWLIRVGGQAAQFVDLTAQECYNENADGDPKFFMETGETLTFGGSIFNNGNVTVDLFTVNWSVRGPGGTIVFTNEVTGGPLARNETGEFSASEDFTPMEAGEYMASCIVNADNDALAANDTTYLRFFVGPLHRWFRYDDNLAADGYTSFTEGNGWGVTFEPSSYPAAVESLRVNVGGAGASDLSIWLHNSEGVPDSLVWSGTPTLAQGWNTVAVSPPVNIFTGEVFTVAFLYTTLSLGQDGTPPNVGEMPHMGTISWQYEGAWGPDNSGNWCIQAYLDTTSAVPTYPIIEVSVDTLQFGTVDTTGNNSTTYDFWVYNRGGGAPLNITAMPVTPVSIRSAFTVVPLNGSVLSGDSLLVSLTFNPSRVQAYNGLLTINSNANNSGALGIPIRAAGGQAGAAEIPNRGLPTAFSLSQNFPNPFNPTTEIEFGLPMASDVRLTVFNMLGQEIALLVNETLPAGVYRQSFDATRLPAGIYFYRLEAGSFTDIRKMMLLK